MENNELIELKLQNESGDCALTISVLPEFNNLHTLRKIDIESTSVAGLNQIFQAIPTFAQGHIAQNGKYMQVIVEGQLYPGKELGLFQPVVRQNGKITEWAQLKETKSLQNAAKFATVWQVASIVVAQKHLADINEKLTALQSGVDSINNHLKNERRSIITRSLSYLQQASFAISQGENSPNLRSQLEAIELDLIGVQEQLFDELCQMKDQTLALEDGDMFGTETIVERIDSHQAHIQQIQKQWLLCVKARAANWQVLCAFPGDASLKKTRLASIEKSIGNMFGNNGLAAKLESTMNVRINQVNALWNLNSTLVDRRNKLRSKFGVANTLIENAANLIKTSLEDIENKVIKYERAITLGFKVDNGKITDVVEVIGI